MLDARKLAVLEALTKHGSFTGAAEALSYTQSAVSQHIAALEREVGVTLIERARRPVALTPAGEQLLEDATPALPHLRRAESRLRDLAQMRTGSIRLGAFPAAHAALVPAALASFRVAHPGVELVLAEAEPSTLLGGLRSGTIDLAIVYTVPGRDHPFLPPVALRHLADDPLVAVLPHGHRLSKRRSIRLQELAGESWVAPKHPNDFRLLFDALCADAGFQPRIAVETLDPHAAIALTEAGVGVLIAASLALHSAPGAATVPVRDIPAARSLWIATISGRRHPAVSALSDALIAAARGFVAKHEDPSSASPTGGYPTRTREAEKRL
jgi:DNA-binding transcriptional LysR family regulator